jgi:hypothetical protein
MQELQNKLVRIQIRAEQVLICLHLMDGKSREAERSGSILLGIGRIGSLRLASVASAQSRDELGLLLQGGQY